MKETFTSYQKIIGANPKEKMNSEAQHIRAVRLRAITRKFLYQLHKAQNCCSACTQCRNTIIDQALEFARHYAVITNNHSSE